MRIAICEDLKQDSALLFNLLDKYLKSNSFDNDIKVDVFKNGEAFISAFSPHKYNILFLDIYMDKNGLTGVEVAEEIRKVDSEIIIIFTTTSNEYGPVSYDVNASYYIVKPVDSEKLEKAMKRCSAQLDLHARAIEIMENRQIVKIRMRDICYAEAIRHNSLLNTTTGTIKTRTVFGSLVEMLSGSLFIPCHRSYIVNLAHVASMEKRDFIMKNGDRVPISKTCQSEVQKAFSEYFWED